MLALEGPKYDISQGFIINNIHIKLSTVTIKQDPNIEGTGGSFWDASIILLNYLQTHIELLGKIVLEIGGGLGLTSIGCKVLGCEKAICTDLEDVIKNTKKNIENNHIFVECIGLDWFSPHYIESNTIIMADVVWVLPLIRPLINTLSLLLNPNNYAIMCYKLRSNIVHESFLKELSQVHLNMQTLSYIEGHFIYKIYCS